MWLEITDKVIDLPGIFILKDNPITVGAWCMLPTQDRFVLWIHKKRYTATFLKDTNLTGEKCTFSITDDFSVISYCGHFSGRSEDKLKNVPTTLIDGYRYVSDSEYVILLSITNIVPIEKYYLVMCEIDKILNFKGGEQWVHLSL